MKQVLVANRGEVAIRVLRAAAELGLTTVAVYAEDDSRSLHVRKADRAVELRGTGPTAYLDMEQLIAVARESGCDAVHPGYGFLSESAAFASRCAEEGLTFVGPRAETLALFGDKTGARAFAAQEGVPLIRGTSEPTTLEGARAFLESLGSGEAMLIKAVAGGGGRGMRIVYEAGELNSAYARAASEAQAAFGSGDLYVEQFLPRARHIEVQIVGDGSEVSHLWERDCSIQRRHQKLVEVAPAPALDPELRSEIIAAALRMARAARYTNLGTFEFLVNLDATPGQPAFAFIEANARLQVEHTVTEEVLGIDLVQTQFEIAAGKTLADLGLTQDGIPEPRGYAIQARVNMETIGPDGAPRPAGGTLAVFEVPSGPGLRTDSFGYAGYTTSPRYDSLLAKVTGHSPSPRFADAVARTRRALGEFRIEGVSTNIPLLQSLLAHPEFRAAGWYTRFRDDHLDDLVAGQQRADRLFFETPPPPREDTSGPASDARVRRAGATVEAGDPLAVLDYGKSGAAAGSIAVLFAHTAPEPVHVEMETPDGAVAVPAPIQGTVVSVAVAEGDEVREGQPLLVMEAMKMEHVIGAPASGVVHRVTVAPGDTIFEGDPLAFILPGEVSVPGGDDAGEVDLDRIRPDLAEVLERQRLKLDEARPDAVERRRRRGSARPARTSTTSATRGPSASTAGWCSRPAPACRSTRWSAASPPTAWSPASGR